MNKNLDGTLSMLLDTPNCTGSKLSIFTAALNTASIASGLPQVFRISGVCGDNSRHSEKTRRAKKFHPVR